MTAKVSKVLSLTLVLTILASMFSVFGIQASAASTYKCMSTKTITITTKNSCFTPSMTFKCKAAKEFGSDGISNYAPKMSLKIYDHTTGKTSWARVTGTGANISSTLKLARNHKYTVTVSYLYDANVNKNALRVGGGKGWADGTWWISSTSNIKSYSIK